jgi:hypothetical protein
MPHVCPATGHVIEHPTGLICPNHGVALFSNCPTCGKAWPQTGFVPTLSGEDRAPDFCEHCASPAPWLDRRQLIHWVKAQIRAAGLEPSRRLELEGVLDHMAEMDPADTRTLAGWQTIRDAAPKVWEKTKQVIDILITAKKIKDALGL